MTREGLEPSNADARGASARRRLDDGGSLMSRVPSASPGVPDLPGVWTSFITREGLEPSNADARWASARRRLDDGGSIRCAAMAARIFEMMTVDRPPGPIGAAFLYRRGDLNRPIPVKGSGTGKSTAERQGTLSECLCETDRCQKERPGTRGVISPRCSP